MASGQNGNILKKIVQLFKTAKRPSPQSGDGKYDSEEDGTPLKTGIIKELHSRKKTVPHDLDLLLEFIRLAKAGGIKTTPSEARPINVDVLIID
jgi:hypothetical protein